MVRVVAGGRREILIATSNPGKYREIAAVLTNSERPIADDEKLSPPPSERMGHPSNRRSTIQWCTLKDLPGEIAEPVEDGLTFAANAAIKARYYSRKSGLWTLADDSGLEVDALEGAPGVLSARYAGTSAGSPRGETDQANNQRLISALQGVPLDKRTARFRCVLMLADGDQILATAEGSIEGLIIDEPRGSNGFGYDPHFFLPDLGKTTAELPAAHKNRISHRGQALRRFREILGKLLGSGC